MRIRSLEELRGGEVLSEGIKDSKQSVLVPKGTVLKPEYIPLIQSLGINEVMIEDPYEKFEKPNPIIDSTKFLKITKRVKILMEKHIYHDGSSLRNSKLLQMNV